MYLEHVVIIELSIFTRMQYHCIHACLRDLGSL